MAEKRKEYGIADKAWHPIIGCSPAMPCAPRCWARKTTARIVECQKGDHPERAAFFASALTPDLKRWNGSVRIDEAHLADPLKWRKPALIASGFHGDWALLSDADKDRILAVMGTVPRHQFMTLTKQPELICRWLQRHRGHFTREYQQNPARTVSRLLPLDNAHIGCSIMNQSEADKHRPAMAELARMGWSTHVWYEPSLGPVDWERWSFLKLIIAGGESGTQARPAHPDWFRRTRDWCAAVGVGFVFKQWGEWQNGSGVEPGNDAIVLNDGRWYRSIIEPDEETKNAWSDFAPTMMAKVGKRVSGCLLDGREHKDLACFLPEGTPASRAERSGE